MTLDEAIKHAEEVANDMKLCCEECAEEHRQLAEWLRELKQLREQTRWIPVSERSPKEDEFEDEFVLVTFGWLRNKEDLAVNIDRISDGEWELSEFVTAWMPLPKPYKAESENKNEDSN